MIENNPVLDSHPSDGVTPGTRLLVLVIVSVSSFITPMAVSSVVVALPAISKDLHLDAATLGWISTVYLLFSSIFLFPFAKLSDIFGRKLVFMIGTAVFTLACSALAFVTSASMLIALRAMQGLGASMTFGTGVAILSSVYPPRARGRAMGITISSVYIGLAAGPFIGGIVTQHFGWHYLFALNVPVGFALVGAILSFVKGEWKEAAGERFDYAGSALYALGLAGIMYGIYNIPTHLAYFAIGTGIVSLCIFFVVEKQVKNPVLDLRLFKNNTIFAMSSLAALINYSATFAVSFMMSLYLQYLRGYTPREAGTLLVVQPLIMAILSPMAGRMSDRIEPRIIATIGMIFTTIGLAMLFFVSPLTPVAYLVVALIILGFGFGLFSSPNTNAVMGAVDRRQYGVASGVLGTMRLTGQMLSMGIATLAFAIFIGKARITPGAYPGFMTSLRFVFGISTFASLFGIVASYRRGNVWKKEE